MINSLDLATGRQLLAALTPGPYQQLDCDSLVIERIEDARAVLWLLEHADQLLTLAERVASVQVRTDAEQRSELASAVRILNGQYAGVSSLSVMPMLAMAVPELLADAITLAALVEQVRR